MASTELSDRGAEQIGGDSMLWYAQAAWRSRWFCLAAVLCGAVWGLQSASRQPRLQTICLFRSVNPVISYLHRNYWDSVGRAKLAQLKVMAEAEGNGARISVRAEPDQWMQRLEIRHYVPGEGQRLAEKFRHRLEEIAGHQPPGDGKAEVDRLSPEREQLTRTLDDLQQKLSRTRQQLQLPAPDDDTQQALSPPQFLTIAPQITEKLPFEYLPDLTRVRRLQRETIEILDHSAGLETKENDLASIKEIQRLLDQSIVALLEYWARMDLFVLAGDRTRVEMDVVFEAEVDVVTEYLRRILLGATFGTIAAILTIVPAIWTRDRWEQITTAAVRPQGAP